MTETRILRIELSSLAETRRVGRALGAALAREALVLCRGEMGAGKTTLIKAICEGLGIDPDSVISPTYTLVNIYPGRWPVYHVDLYRLSGPGELEEMDRDDWINPEGPSLVEWPERAGPLLDDGSPLVVSLAHVEENPDARALVLAGEGPEYDPVYRALAGGE